MRHDVKVGIDEDEKKGCSQGGPFFCETFHAIGFILALGHYLDKRQYFDDVLQDMEYDCGIVGHA